ncbi:hypothetical protein CVT91_12070 [Candidatus Atribacteria bacterium HGW-Atribacteria-1]|nr:MAG: hypothetical protein CVT91_12070 [Candidatus Atribacteria bacterium HGW-Atribacteria-1]
MATSDWITKGATLSDKSARKEFGLTQEEIFKAINEGKLQYRVNYAHGTPYFKLIRGEVETFVNEKYGEDYLDKKKLKNKLTQVNKELRELKSKISSLEKRKAELMENIGE